MGVAGVPNPHDARLRLSERQLEHAASGIESLHRRHYGSDIGHASAHQTNTMVTVVLSGVVTRDERFLMGRGRADLVAGFHRAFQKAMRQQFVAAVERAVGMQVRAVDTSVDVERDTTIERFFLADDAATRRFVRAG